MDFETLIVNQALTLLTPLSMESKVKFLAKLTTLMATPPTAAPSAAAAKKKAKETTSATHEPKVVAATQEPKSSSNAAAAPPLASKAKKEKKAKAVSATDSDSSSNASHVSADRRKHHPATLAWIAYEKNLIATHPELFEGVTLAVKKKQIASAYKKEHSDDYAAFVEKFKADFAAGLIPPPPKSAYYLAKEAKEAKSNAPNPFDSLDSEL